MDERDALLNIHRQFLKELETTVADVESGEVGPTTYGLAIAAALERALHPLITVESPTTQERYGITT